MTLRHSRARSIKTRIETLRLEAGDLQLSDIREQDPLKQGLKPVRGCYFLRWT